MFFSPTPLVMRLVLPALELEGDQPQNEHGVMIYLSPGIFLKS